MFSKYSFKWLLPCKVANFFYNYFLWLRRCFFIRPVCFSTRFIVKERCYYTEHMSSFLYIRVHLGPKNFAIFETYNLKIPDKLDVCLSRVSPLHLAVSNVQAQIRNLDFTRYNDNKDVQRITRTSFWISVANISSRDRFILVQLQCRCHAKNKHKCSKNCTTYHVDKLISLPKPSWSL